MKRLVMVLMFMIPASTQAGPTPQWFSRQAEGWFWYVTPPPEEQGGKTTDETRSTQPPVPARPDPVIELEAFRERLTKAQALALMQPSHENVAAYLQLQKQAMETSQRFAQVWQQVVWTTPELDHTLVRPTSPQAVNAYYDAQNAQRKVRLNTIARSHGLFYFFRAGCPYCRRFSPMLKHFAEQHGFHITAISLDGGASPGFPQPRVDNGTAKRLGVKTVPALYLIEPRSRSVQAVSFGLVSPAELEQRIITLLDSPSGDTL